MPSQSLTRPEARERAELVTVTRMRVDLDLDQGDREFGSRTRVEFDCARPGAATFADLRPHAVHRLTLDGADLDPALLRDGRLPLADLAEHNVLEVEATMLYSRDGQGLHRSTDPADGEDYVYGHLFLDNAPTVFACFDQPDLKAPYDVTVRAPAGWVVLGNGAATRTTDSPATSPTDSAATSPAAGTWTLATTEPLATYYVTVCAGPYVSVTAEHDGIPLGLHARRSLEPQLHEHAEQLLTVTRQSFDYYHRLFGIRYPYGEYHQVFVPEFNAGAMENPGCVTIRDQYLFRGAVSRGEQLTRANTVSHEMAHMWFGDLVTMRWWDDLWLNESFAEYMAYRCLTDATEFTDAWVEFGAIRTLWGYAADRAPSTHPVAGDPGLDAHAALQNFDGISYAKGAAVLRQLIAHIGDGAFVTGVTAYLREHAHGNGELAEFLTAIERAADRDLTGWARGWLQTAGADTLALDDGTLTRHTPPEHPADRAHTMTVATWSGGRELTRERVTVTGGRTPVPGVDAVCRAAATGATAPTLLLPNADGSTWAGVALDATTLEHAEEIALVDDALARGVLWVALVEGVKVARVDPARLIEVVGAAWPRERDDVLLSQVALQCTERVIPCFVPPAGQPAARRTLAAAADELLERAGADSDAGLVAHRVLARTSPDEARLRAWLEGRDLPERLAGDLDLRWSIVRALAARGALDEQGVEQARRADDTLTGRLAALEASATIPTREAKERAWGRLTEVRGLSNYESLAVSRGLWSAPDLDLVRPFVERYPDAMVGLTSWMGDDALSRVATVAFPRTVVEPQTARMSAAMLERGDLTAGVRRAVVDQDAALAEALRSRAVFG